MTRIRPFLKWAGSKIRCIESILKTLPPADRLIEPFTGSGAIFINSNYKNYWLAEQNKDLVNLYLALQEGGVDFIHYCAKLFSSKNNLAERYYQLREEFNHCKDKHYRASLFLYLNRHGYNGLCRYNNSGFYNVPFGRYLNPYFPLNEMGNFYTKSKSAKFILDDFRQTFLQARPGDLIYCDPPYVPLSSSSNFSLYTGTKFTEQDQLDLAHLAIETAQKGISVVISNHDTEYTRELYHQGKIISFPVRRTISCQTHKRITAQELIVTFEGIR